MRLQIPLILSTLLLLLVFPSCNQDTVNPANCDGVTLTYNADIAPIIQSNCATSGCHSASSHNGTFETYAQLYPYLENGTIRYYVIDQKYMPPFPHKLNTTDLQSIQCWLDNGYPEK
ncbi:MAG: hypothetical protein H6563_14380 [Lewinellaceae bacterium]|nr:hypothetical protein [Lewinellaceae bacterium]